MILSRLLFPKSIAFIGGNECDIAIRRTRELGFAGTIHAVHPSREQLGGIATVKSVDDITGEIDAAFIAVKREPTIEIVRSLRKQNCGGAVIYAAGFAETGATHLQDELLDAADGMPLMGPNCYGFINTLSKVALWPDEHGLKPPRQRCGHHNAIRQHRLQSHLHKACSSYCCCLHHRQSGRY